MSHQTDLIIVGAGSAGCVLAAELAVQTGLRITIVEPDSTPAPLCDRERPSRWLKLLGSSDDWNLQTAPSAHLANRRIAWPRGRGVGGSSRINAMIWFPPTETDFAAWVAASGGRHTIDQWRAAYAKAELLVCPEQPRWISEASKTFLDATSGMPQSQPMVYRRTNRRGRRFDLASLLDSVTLVRATADKVLWDGDRAIGVSIIKDGTTSEFKSSKGVVLCGGAIATPTILMRSGIGPTNELARHGIATRIDRPMVGENLQDHLVMPVIFETNSKVFFQLNSSVADLARWQIMGAGPVASNVAECGGLFAGGDFQIHVTPTNYLSFPKPSVTPVMTLAVNLTRPQSRGRLTLGSAHVDSQPCIDSNYLGHPNDQKQLVCGVELVRSIVRLSPLADLVTGEVLPGTRRSNELAITKSIARYARTLYHPVGTSHFGDQSDSPVDPGFRVRGAERLWVADASILPTLTTGNPNASVMTLALMASDTIASQVDSDRQI